MTYKHTQQSEWNSQNLILSKGRHKRDTMYDSETDNTYDLNLARAQIGTWTQGPGLEPSQKPDRDLNPRFFKIRITHPVSELTEIQALGASVQKEFSERQSDRQEIDLLR